MVDYNEIRQQFLANIRCINQSARVAQSYLTPMISDAVVGIVAEYLLHLRPRLADGILALDGGFLGYPDYSQYDVAMGEPNYPQEITPLVAMFRERGIRIFGTVEDPLFSALDVATHIGDAVNYIKIVNKYTPGEYTQKIEATNARGEKRLTLFLTEPGLYKYLLQAKGPIAEEFQRFVYGVLKAERKRTVNEVWLALRISQSKNEDLLRMKASLERNEQRLYKAANDAREKSAELAKENAALRKAKNAAADDAYLARMGRSAPVVEDSGESTDSADEGDESNEGY